MRRFSALPAVAALIVAARLDASPDAREVPIYDFSDIHESLWVAVVVDRSGSMQGRPLARARAQAAATIASLNETAHLALASFGEEGARWREGWTPADEAGALEAGAWLETLAPFGRTSPAAGVAAALAEPAPVEDATVLVLITDGDPDRGMADAEDCVAAAGGAPAFVLLVVDPRSPRLAASRGWGRRVAEATGGHCEEIAP